jgi:CRISPR-associated protein Cmr2
LQRLRLISDQEQAGKKWKTYAEKVLRIADPKITEAAEAAPEDRQLVQLERIPPNHYEPHPILGDGEGTMLFEERLADLVEVAVNPENLREASDALHDFYKFTDSQFAAQGRALARPNPYYALLLADGDSMGAMIDAQANPAQHRRLSQMLGQFAGSVSAIVKKHQGALVYAGGDDVLAFVPLHTVLWCAQELATNFREVLKEFFDSHGHSPTLSVGIVIVHHLDSLREALDLARSAERRAKQVEGKNALAITVSKRSGEDYHIAGTWGDLDKFLEQLIPLCQIDAIPNGTAYELRDLAWRLTVPKSDDHFERLQKVIMWDALRILQRKLRVPQGKLSQEQAGKVESLLKERLGIGELGGGNLTSVDNKAFMIEEFINELIVAQVLADALQLADPKKELSNGSLDH